MNLNSTTPLKLSLGPIVDIGGYSIDLRKIEIVGPLDGDASCLRYTVSFGSGIEIKIYEERKNYDGVTVSQMPREKFIQLWKEYNK